MDYGLAIFGCPAHDQRDLEFASKYNLSYSSCYAENKSIKIKNKAYRVRYLFNSKFLNNLRVPESIPKTIEFLEKKI